MTGARQVISGELHYPRIPHQYWAARFAMAAAMGLDTISTYTFWNVHEQQRGSYDFSGQRDVARFVRLAAAAGLDVILRPGPYVCAEWDFGGLPAWLLADGARVRTTDERYLAPVLRWLRHLGEQLAPLLRSRGGPIVAVQLENEYGAFGNDTDYLRALRAALVDAGFDGVPFYTIDQPADALRGCLPDLPIALTFGPGDPRANFETLRAARPNAPMLCGEYWAGWFDHWGEPHAHDDPAQEARDLAWMLAAGASVNLYMFHGGTSFGFWNGANTDEQARYRPTTTSYDYRAALDESGRPTPKYFAFREVIAGHTERALPAVPHLEPVLSLPAPVLVETAALSQAFGRAFAAPDPLPMESVGQAYGYILYQTRIRGAARGELAIEALRDYAVVCVDGDVVGRLDRRLGESVLSIDRAPEGSLLEILVENGGRVNYGPDFPFEQKGITRAVYWNGQPLLDWTVRPLDLRTLPALAFSEQSRNAPAFHRGTFEMGECADIYIETSSLGKGSLWVNGQHAGRFWDVGPQQALYVPAPWLRPGRNEVIAFIL
ncbi:MAG TPA: beta-galactosidase family protein [Candidatus Baltobacteraceae bacterium]|nr:beta-galactosidase family protein [Candidatus Baltobacteraceae bacterium]